MAAGTRQQLRGGLGAASFAGSGIAFLVAIAYLYIAEGPGSPDVLTTLASPGGRQFFDGTVAAGVVAVILNVSAVTILFVQLRWANEVAMLMVLVLSTVVAPVVIAFLAFQYALVAVAQEGVSTNDPAFRQLVVTAHAFADVGGWASIGMLAVSVLIVSLVLRQVSRWPALSTSGLGIVLVALILFVLNASYLFLVPFGLWQIALAAGILTAGKRPLTGPG